MSSRYSASESFLTRARSAIPLGAQTFSKSVTQYPLGASPYFAAHAKGSRLWDLDGNEYIDYVNALAAVTLGYCDPDVNAAVSKQLAYGSIFSLSSPLEAEVAELIIAMVPSAEMVRFGKNGSDATAGAVRVARAYTARDHVFVCGYHGWQDWYIGTTARHKGVPQATRGLTHSFPYDDLPALRSLFDRFADQVAAVILEPMNVREPSPGYLEAVKDITHAAGAVLIFDEMITGFRFAQGGAQELFGVTPDLTTLGKGLANGLPLSALCGRRELMMELEEVFYSFTMGGEALSLAGAKAVLTKIEREPILETLNARGASLKSGVAEKIEEHGMSEILTVSGHPTWSFLSFVDGDSANAWDIQTLFLQEIFRRGILALGTHNMSYAHSEDDVDSLLAAYNEVFPIIRRSVEEGNVRQHLTCMPLQPLFKVRS